MKAVGLQALYNDPARPEVRTYARKLMATAFLPPAEVGGAYNALQLQAPVVPRIEDFNDYFNSKISSHFSIIHFYQGAKLCFGVHLTS